METLPTWPLSTIERLKSLVLDSVTSAESKRAYSRGLTHFLSWYPVGAPESGFSKATVQAYRTHLLESGLSPSTINLQITAVRRLAVEAGDNGLLAPEIVSGIQRVRGIRREGTRIGNWLTVSQAEQLINAPDVSTLKGKRDRALLALLIGCGLRREEAASLTLDHLQLRDGRFVIVDLEGKGRRVRSVPVPSFAVAALQDWTQATGFSSGRLFRRVNRGGRLAGESMTAQSIFETVKQYAGDIGLPGIAPHDLRRTFAKLAHRGKAALEQIQICLGHASIQTTERYLGIQQDFEDSPVDRLGLKLAATV
ncbi:MAG: tyrosine-type recombinase/integrase [Bryobacteraceae bacterium]